MRLLLAFVRRDHLINTSYRASFAFQVVTVFVAVPVLFLVGRLFQGVEVDALRRYGGNYFAFLLIGGALFDYLAVSFTAFTTNIRESQLSGTLEIVLLSPTATWQMLLFSSVWVYLFTSFRLVVYLIMGVAFGAPLGNARLAAGALVLVIGMFSFASIGVLLASLVIVLKRGEVITSAVTYAAVVLGGLLFPVSSLPRFLQIVASALPVTHVAEGMRLALLQGHGLGQLAPILARLTVFAVILTPLSLTAFAAAVKHTKAAGTLTQF